MSPSDNRGFRKEPILPVVTASDDLARLIAAHREVKPWVCLCGWWSAIQEPDGSDYARHLASVVSRRDTDLQAKAWDEGYMRGMYPWTSKEQQADPIPAKHSPPTFGPNANPYRVVVDGPDDSTRCTAVVKAASRHGGRCQFKAVSGGLCKIHARSRRPADTDTGRGQ